MQSIVGGDDNAGLLYWNHEIFVDSCFVLILLVDICIKNVVFKI